MIDSVLNLVPFLNDRHTLSNINIFRFISFRSFLPSPPVLYWKWNCSLGRWSLSTQRLWSQKRILERQKGCYWGELVVYYWRIFKVLPCLLKNECWPTHRPTTRERRLPDANTCNWLVSIRRVKDWLENVDAEVVTWNFIILMIMSSRNYLNSHRVPCAPQYRVKSWLALW